MEFKLSVSSLFVIYSFSFTSLCGVWEVVFYREINGFKTDGGNTLKITPNT